MSDDIQLSAWGLADEIVPDIDPGTQLKKFLFGTVGDEHIAVADINIREVVDRPKITPWLQDDCIAGVFALRGDIYTLTDPLRQGQARRIAVVLEQENRFIAVGLDDMTGVKLIADNEWEEFESSSYTWAKRIWDDLNMTSIELEPELYIESIETGGADQHSKEPSS